MEEVLFKNVSAMGEKEAKALIKVTGKRAMIIFSLVFPLIFIALGVTFILLDDLDFALWMFAFAIAFVIVFPLLFLFSAKQANKQVIGGKRLLNTFEFKEDILSIATENLQDGNSLVSGTSNLYYKDLFKCLVTNEYIFLFINQRQSFILDVNGMVQGEANDLIEFLKTKMVKFQDKRKLA